MSNRSLARQLSRRSLYVDMYPIVHRRSLGELIDAFLCHFDPVADADFTPEVLSSSKSLKIRTVSPAHIQDCPSKEHRPQNKGPAVPILRYRSGMARMT